MQTYNIIKTDFDFADNNYQLNRNIEDNILTTINILKDLIISNKTYYNDNDIENSLNAFVNAIISRYNQTILYFDKEDNYNELNNKVIFLTTRITETNTLLDLTTNFVNITSQNITNYINHINKNNMFIEKFEVYKTKFSPVFITYSNKISSYIKTQALYYLNEALQAEKEDNTKSVSNELTVLLTNKTNYYIEIYEDIPNIQANLNNYFESENNLRIIGDNYYLLTQELANAEIDAEAEYSKKFVEIKDQGNSDAYSKCAASAHIDVVNALLFTIITNNITRIIIII
jgi:hypothetical protein